MAENKFPFSSLLVGPMCYNRVRTEKENTMTTFAFDFDHTLATTACNTFDDYRDPVFVDDAIELPLVDFAARVSRAHKVVILTARSVEGGIGDAIAAFCDRNGIDVAEIIGVADLFRAIKIRGKRAARKLRTEEKKALMLARWAHNGPVCFWDDDERNVDAAAQIDGVIATKVEV